MKTFEFDHVIMGAGIVGVWLARRLLSMGRSVALVDIGSADADESRIPSPVVYFAERENLGVTKARNQVFTGNSKYWGGGLIRNDAHSLCKMFNLPNSSSILEEFVECYQFVEKQFGMPSKTCASFDGNVRISEISVLPGKYRDIANKLLQPFSGGQKLKVFCNAEIVKLNFGMNNRIEAVTLSLPDQPRFVLVAKHFVLSMGVVDSNIFALKTLLPNLKKTGHLIGKNLNDHWSIPIAKIEWKNNAGLDWLYPPKFRGDFIQGVHAEINSVCPWGLQAGFLHLQADYDRVEPYATIKKFLNGRQQGMRLGAQLQSLLPIIWHVGKLAALGYNRYVRRKLFVPDGMELNFVMDFESYPSRENKLVVENGVTKLYWDVREEDVVIFSSLLEQSKELIRQWARGSGLQVELLIEGGNSGTLAEYLRKHVIDAYHLGGGLTVGATSEESVLNQDFRFHEIDNLAAIGTATFSKAGVANPVETLLALCERYSRTIVKYEKEQHAWK